MIKMAGFNDITMFDQKGSIYAFSWMAILFFIIFLVSRLIVGEKYFVLFAFPLIILYLLLPLNLKVTFLILGCFYPLSFGNLGPIPVFLWKDWMGPLIVGIMLYHILSKQKRIFPEKCFPMLSGIFVLVLWAVINYIRHPVLAEKLMGVSESAGGIRSYFDIWVGVCIFFAALWYARYEFSDETFWENVLKVLLTFSLVIGIIRIFSHFLSFDIPFMYGVFAHSIKSFSLSQYGGTAYRIGGLSETATIGIAALFAIKRGNSFQIRDMLLLISLCMILFLSGGRAATVGLLAAISSYCFLFEKKRFPLILSAILALSIVVLLLSSNDLLTGQFNRLTALKGGFRIQDQYRYTTIQNMWEAFISNPIFGRGIGYFGKGIGAQEAFVFSKLKAGGHGSYISVLYIFGIGGGYFLFITLFTSLMNSVRMMRPKINSGLSNSNFSVMNTFIVIYLIIKIFEYVAGGSGYKDMTLYLLAGVSAGLYSKHGAVYEKE